MRLFDTNLLIALFWPSHARHSLAVDWFAEHRKSGWATCPLTETGFVRIVSNPSFSKDAIRPKDALKVLRLNTKSVDHQFWTPKSPFPDLIDRWDLKIVGHQQVTDAYLLALALERGAKLATLDRGKRSLVSHDAQDSLEVIE